MPDKRANPVAFAQTTIHELAQIRATVQHLSELFLDDIGNRHNLDDADKAKLRREFRTHVNAKATKFYQLYAHEIGVENQSQQDGPEETNRPAP
jgi:hypothetical protein